MKLFFCFDKIAFGIGLSRMANCNTYFYFLYEGQSKNNEPKSLLAIFVAIKSKVIHQKKAQG